MSHQEEENILIKRILNAETYYDKLGVRNDASDQQIATACKKLLLKVHTDKCKHPQAKETTQVLIQVYKILKENRKEYDESLRTHTTFDISKVRVSDEDIEIILKGLGIGILAASAGLAIGALINWLFGSDQVDVEKEDSIEENIEQENSTKVQNEKTPLNKRKREATDCQQNESNEKVEKDLEKKPISEKKRKLE